MPLELGIWRIDNGLQRLDVKSLEQEERLEEFLDKDISIASPNWMVIGRQVYTDYGKYIDLLAIDKLYGCMGTGAGGNRKLYMKLQRS